MPTEVTDTDLLNQLNGTQEVTDPALLQQLNAQQFGTGQSYDAVGGQLVPTGSADAKAAQSPLPDLTPTGVGPLDDFATFSRNALLGYGKGISGYGLAVRQMAGQANPNEYAARNDPNDPLNQSWGGKIGNFAGIAAPAVATGGYLSALAPLTGASAIAGGGLVGGITAGLQPAASESNRFQNEALGMGFGGLTSGVTDAIDARYPNTFSGMSEEDSATQQSIDAGQRMGMRATPGQASGSVAQQQFEARLSSSPYTSGPFNQLNQGNRDIVNNAWARAIGEGGDEVSGRTMANAAERTGDVFNSVRNANNVLTTNPATTSGVLDKIDNDYLGLLPSDSIRSNPLVSRLESLTSAGSINGEQLGNLSSNLGSASYREMTGVSGNRQLGMALGEVKDHVDDMVQSTLNGDELADYLRARTQYRALSQLNARTGNVNPDTGQVNAVNMASYLQKSDKGGYTYGNNQSDAYNSLRFMNATRPVVGNSGTATRSPEGLTGMLMALPGRFLSKSYLGGPNTGLLYNTIGRPMGAAIRGAVSAPGAITAGIDSATSASAPYIVPGLPGMVGSSVPYILQ